MLHVHSPTWCRLTFFPSISFPGATSRPLCGRSPTEIEKRYLSDKLISLQGNIFIYYLLVILKLQQLPPPPLQPTGKCPTYIKHWSFKSKVFVGYTKTTIQESGIN